MIEIRTFQGDEHELSNFTVSIWRKWYAGKMPIPLWSAPYFRRELFSTDDGSRDHLVAAYDGTRLVGSHPARPMRIVLNGDERPATWGSYLTVDPEYRRQGVAKLMHLEQDRRLREKGNVVHFGYLYVRTWRSLGSKFWLKVRSGTTPIRRLGTWARPLDHHSVAAFDLYRGEAVGTRIASCFQSQPTSVDTEELRDYRHDDLDACARLVEGRSRRADLGYLWSPAELARFFHSEGLSRTVVFEQDGRIEGLVNYFRLSFLGRCEMEVGVIDFIAFDNLPHASRVSLLRAALTRMASEGLKAALLLRGSWYGWRALLAAGFFPLPPEYVYAGTKIMPDISFSRVRRVHSIWR